MVDWQGAARRRLPITPSRSPRRSWATPQDSSGPAASVALAHVVAAADGAPRGRASVELRQLRFVVTLSEELHFRRAAERAHIAQPAFSEQIRRLEVELGVQLFDRTSHYVRLTEAGRLFLEEITLGLAQLDRAAAIAEQAGKGKLGRVRIGFVGSAANELTPRILRVFADRHPTVSVTLRAFDIDNPSAGLTNDDVDAAFIRPPVAGQDALVVVPLFTEPRVVVVAEDHPLASEKTVSIRQLLSERFVAAPRSTGVSRDFWLASEFRDGVSPNVAAEAATLEELLQVVAAGGGIALVPASSERFHARPGVRFVQVPDVGRTAVALAHQIASASPLVRAFVEVAKAVAGDVAFIPAGAASCIGRDAAHAASPVIA